MNALLVRLEALAEEWQEFADAIDLNEPREFERIFNLATRSAVLDCIDDVRTILREA